MKLRSGNLNIHCADRRKKENNGRQVVSDFNDIVFITGVLLLSGLGHGDLRSYLLQINKA